MRILTLETPELGDRSYLVHDGSTALVVDPQRDIDRVLAAAEAEGVRIAAVAETHLHNDYVTGGLALARRTGARYLVNADDQVAFDRDAVRDGDTVEVGRLQVAVVHTPGHTPGHLSYVVREDGEPRAVFTGGSVLYGTVGRTDLIAAEVTEELTRAQFRSARRLAALPDSVTVHPTHGFGSFCSSAKTSGSQESTIGEERRGNLVFTIDDEDTFVRTLLSGLTAYPRYYVHMADLNRRGPGEPDLTPPEPVDADTVRKRIAAGEWVVDLRQRRAYAGGHLAGSLGVELGTLFATYLGWVLPWGTPLTLLGDSPEEVAKAQRDLVRIGVDHLAGAAVGPPERLAGGEPLRAYRVTDFAELARQPRDSTHVLDVRRDDEWAGGHIEGAQHIPLQDLSERLAEVPDRELWVHCQGGFRASIAASLLDRAGHDVVLIDDDFDHAAPAGLAVVH